MSRRALFGVLLLLAAIFAGSVLCPPVRERAAPPEETVGRADTLPPPADSRTAGETPDGARTEAGRSEVPPPSQPVSVLEVRVVDDQGTPLTAGRVQLLGAAPPREDAAALQEVAGEREDSPWITLGTYVVAEGLARVRLPAPGSYRLQATAEGMLAAVQDLDWPRAAEAPTPELRLTRGARIRGSVQDLAGRTVFHGELLFKAEGEASRGARVQGQTGFDSGPLPAGAWVVRWRRHAHAEGDPRLRYHTQLGPGETLELLFTLDEGEPPLPGATVGVVPAPPR